MSKPNGACATIIEAQARIDDARAQARTLTPAEAARAAEAPNGAHAPPDAQTRQTKPKRSQAEVRRRFDLINAAALKTPELHASTRAVLSALVAHASAKDGTTFVSRETLAAELGIRKEAVTIHMTRLRAGGYVVTVKRENPAAGRAAVKRVTDPSSWPKSKPELRRRLQEAEAKREAEKAAASADGTNPPADAGAGGRQPLHGGPAHER